MDMNIVLGIVFLATGVIDLIFARILADKLPPAGRSLLLVFGGLFILLGLIMLTGRLRLA